MPMRKYILMTNTVGRPPGWLDINELELRALLAALEFARENGPNWWTKTGYINRLYDALLDFWNAHVAA